MPVLAITYAGAIATVKGTRNDSDKNRTFKNAKNQLAIAQLVFREHDAFL